MSKWWGCGWAEQPLDGVLVPKVALDRSSPVPLYFQVATRLQEQIEGGELPVGGRLENEVELADRLGVSRPTMRKAIGYLVERTSVRRRGVGTQIVHPKVRRPVELTSRYDDLAKTGRAPRTEIRSLEVGACHRRRRRDAGHPDRHARSPASSGSATRATSRWRSCTTRFRWTSWPLRADDLEQRGLYEILRSAGRVPRIASQVVGAKAATATEARLLGDPRGAPMLTMTRTAWDESGRGVEYGSHVYRASRYSLRAHPDLLTIFAASQRRWGVTARPTPFRCWSRRWRTPRGAVARPA